MSLQSDQLSSEPLVLEGEQLDDQSMTNLCKSEDGTTTCPEGIVIQPQLNGTDLNVQYNNTVQASTEVIDGEHYLRLMNSGEHLSEGTCSCSVNFMSIIKFF